MAVRLRAFDNVTDLPLGDFLVESLTINKEIGASSTWNATIPINIGNTDLLAEDTKVRMFDGSDFLLEGVIQTTNVDEQSATSTIKLSGRDVLDELFDSSVNTLMMVENENILSALHRILSQAGWRVGDISTLTDPDQVIELLSLRVKTTVLEQVRRILELQDFTFFVSGSDILGEHSLDVGVFEKPTGIQFRTPGRKYYPGVGNFNKIQSLTSKDTVDELINVLEAIGGQVTDQNSVTRLITLHDAWQFDNDLATDPDFPIVEIVPGQRYAVVNRSQAPYPGGTWYSTPDAVVTSTILIGDLAPSVSTRWVGNSFRGIPGLLREVQIVTDDAIGDFYNTYTNQPMSIWLVELGTPATYTFDYDNSLKLIDDIYNFPLPPTDSLLKFDLSSYEIVLEWDKIYGFAFGFDAGLGVDDHLTVLYSNTAPGSTVGMGHSRFDLANDKITWVARDFMSPLRVITSEHNTDARWGLEHWSQYAPQKTDGDSTLSEIKSAGKALYDRAVANLKDREISRKTYSMSAIGPELVVPLGGTVQVYSRSETSSKNPVTGVVNPIYRTVDEELITKKMSLIYANNEKSATYSLAPETRTSEDLLIDLYDKSREGREKQITGAVSPFFATNEMQKIIFPIVFGQNPDTTLADGTAALQVTLPYTAPTDRHYADYVGIPFGDGLLVEIVSAPDNELGVGLVCNVSVKGGWNFSSFGSLTAYYFWE